MKPILKYGLSFLVALLLLPGILQSAHFFSNHEHHNFCGEHTDSHFHKKTIDCAFLSFQQHSFPAIDFINFEIFIPDTGFNKPESQYTFLQARNVEVTFLRGPPVFL